MKIIWTPEAKDSFSQNLDYLLAEWGDQVTSDFLDRVDEVILRLSKNPKIYPVINPSDNIHRCVVVKQISLYYRIVSTTQIDLITFWNNFQNPEKLKL